VAKFYRPGRWTEEQIQEEHRFLFDLIEAEIPAIAPTPFPDGRTLHEKGGIYYAIFPKVGGRAPDEFSDEQLLRIGRLLGRVHNVGAAHEAKHRLEITPETYGIANLEYLLSRSLVPLEYQRRYESVVRAICSRIGPWFEGIRKHRLHGDCHPGNLLWNQQGPFFLDFDDMLVGPAAQDLWLLIPGRDEEARRQRDLLLQGYEELRSFDRTTLRLIEGLRALRFVHYTTWVARRWDDPAFPIAFPEFGTHQYWEDETLDLEEQLRQIN
jgi:Ser/Thr protein kinase RdoA (MazF antagonist)